MKLITYLSILFGLLLSAETLLPTDETAEETLGSNAATFPVPDAKETLGSDALTTTAAEAETTTAAEAETTTAAEAETTTAAEAETTTAAEAETTIAAEAETTIADETETTTAAEAETTTAAEDGMTTETGVQGTTKDSEVTEGQAQHSELERECKADDIELEGTCAAIQGPATAENVEDEHCKLPIHHEHSQLICDKRFIQNSEVLESIVCYQACSFGYTFREGVQRFTSCYLHVGVWYPYDPFQDCKPFVDCGISLEAPGKLFCEINVDEPEENRVSAVGCLISCHPYEDKIKVQEGFYGCDLYGRWSPSLPHCVKAGSGIKLVKAPTPRFVRRKTDQEWADYWNIGKWKSGVLWENHKAKQLEF